MYQYTVYYTKNRVFNGYIDGDNQITVVKTNVYWAA